MIEVVVFHLNTAKKSSVHFEHLIISLITETTVLPKLSYQNDNLIASVAEPPEFSF